RQYSEHPARYEYWLTQAGEELYPVILTLMRWGDEHLAGADGPPLVLEHACGHPLVPKVVCEACGGPADAHTARRPLAEATPRARATSAGGENDQVHLARRSAKRLADRADLGTGDWPVAAGAVQPDGDRVAAGAVGNVGPVGAIGPRCAPVAQRRHHRGQRPALGGEQVFVAVWPLLIAAAFE